MTVSEKIRHALAQEFVTAHGIGLSISSSIGVAFYPDHGATEKDLMGLGDEAMYSAKRGGGNAVHLCTATLSESGPVAEAGAPQSYVHLRWKAAFNSGNAVLDQGHEALFQLVNALLDKVVMRSRQPLEFEAAFRALLEHVGLHFAQEEGILLAQGYAGLAAHAQQHQDLLMRARALHQQLQCAPEQAGAERALIKFLVAEMVVGHMLQSDREFFGLFAKS